MLKQMHVLLCCVTVGIAMSAFANTKPQYTSDGGVTCWGQNTRSNHRSP